MKANLLDLFRDALMIMRFKYRPAAEYDYGLPVFLAVLVAIGVTQAATTPPIFGTSGTAFAFVMLVSTTKWLVFTRTAAEILRVSGSPRIPFLGYTLASEALMLPHLLLLHRPEWGLLVSVLTTWAWWAQAIGLYEISKQSVWKVALVYALSLLISALLCGLFLAGFVAEGWLDLQVIEKNMNEYILKLKNI